MLVSPPHLGLGWAGVEPGDGAPPPKRTVPKHVPLTRFACALHVISMHSHVTGMPRHLANTPDGLDPQSMCQGLVWDGKGLSTSGVVSYLEVT